MKAFEPNSAIYAKGIAVGHSDIERDGIVFRFRDELFSFRFTPACAKYNGYFYEAPVRKLRKLKKGKKG